MTATGYCQGQYAGPNTVRALDYNGHEVIGVQISDAAPDGACFFVTLDDHMQVSITPVIAASIRPYEPAEPPPLPEIEPEDYAATRKSLEELLARMLSHSLEGPDQLRGCGLAMCELADVVDAQIRLEARPHAGQAAGASTCTEEVGSASLANVYTIEVASACRAADGEADAEREGKAFTDTVGSASLADRSEMRP